MTYIWSNQLLAVWSAAGETRNFVLQPLPRAEEAVQSANYIKPSQFLSITSGSEHPRESAEFINFFVNSIKANEELLGERGIPASSTVRAAIKDKLDKYQQASFTFLDVIGSTAAPINPPEPPGHTDLIDNVYWPLVMDPFCYEKDSAENLVPLLREKMPIILEDNKKMDQSSVAPPMRKRRKNLRENNLAAYIFLSPWLIGFFAFTIIPMAVSLWLAFTKYDGVRPPQWIGLGNFIKMFTPGTDTRRPFLRSTNALMSSSPRLVW